MPSFDLVREPWLPCELLTGERRLFGLEEVFVEAAHIRDLYDGSPLVTGALHRLLLAILHRVHGPESAAAWAALWVDKELTGERLVGTLAYLGGSRDRFDLFDQVRPFYQTPGLPSDRAWRSVRLAHELAAKTDATLFDHTTHATAPALSPAAAARYLVATQAFALQGKVSFNDKHENAADAAPLANAALVLIGGRNLFETLLLNFHWCSGGDQEPFPFDSSKDKPAWERDDGTSMDDRRPDGYLDWLTWQSRRILLFPEQDVDGDWVVPRVAVTKGAQLPKKPERVWRKPFETMLAFKRRLEPDKNKDPWPAVRFSPRRAVWRDSVALCESLTDRRARPKTMDWLRDVQRETDVLLPAEFDVTMFGLASVNKRQELWRRERFTFSPAYLVEPVLPATLRSALRLAEEVGDLLTLGRDERPDGGKTAKKEQRPIRVLANTVLPRVDQEENERKKGKSKAAEDRTEAWVRSLGIERRYWARLDGPFRRLFQRLPNERSDELIHGDTEVWFGRRGALLVWAGEVQKAAETAFAEGTTAFRGTGRGIKGVAEAQDVFDDRLRRLVGRRRREWRATKATNEEAQA